MGKGIEHASRYLRENDAIAALLDAVAHQRELLTAVRARLPEPLDAHCLHASVDGPVLILITDSPAWGSRLRFFAPELQTSLAPSHGPIKSCRVRIQPQRVSRHTEEKPQRRARLSARTRRHLTAAADGVEDPVIADALRRLAAAGEGR